MSNSCDYIANVPNETLRVLLMDLDFLANVMENQKYCFKGKYYVDKYSLISMFFRIKDGESQDVNGLSKMGSICKIACETYQQYQSNIHFGPIIINKMIGARKGLERVALTYESLGKIVTAANIRNQGILLLDGAIPKNHRIKEGFNLFNTSD